jgi:hypothetical protein
VARQTAQYREDDMILTQWIPDEATRNRILVQNPEASTASGNRLEQAARGIQANEFQANRRTK